MENKKIIQEYKKFKKYCINPEVLKDINTFEEFHEYYEKARYYPSPNNKFKFIRVGRNRDLEPVDYGVADLMEELNEKGYTTKYCCSGHAREFYKSGYIYFDQNSICSEKLQRLKDILEIDSEFVKFSIDSSGDIIRFSPKVNLIAVKLSEKDYYNEICCVIRKGLGL